jgi:hypothetical protein
MTNKKQKNPTITWVQDPIGLKHTVAIANVWHIIEPSLDTLILMKANGGGWTKEEVFTSLVQRKSSVGLLSVYGDNPGEDGIIIVQIVTNPDQSKNLFIWITQSDTGRNVCGTFSDLLNEQAILNGCESITLSTNQEQVIKIAAREGFVVDTVKLSRPITNEMIENYKQVNSITSNTENKEIE